MENVAFGSLPQVLIFKGKPINLSFQNRLLMINGNDMAQIFGREIVDFIKREETKNYIKIFLQKKMHWRIKTFDDLILFKDGEFWLYDFIAIKLAEWLDMEFHIWLMGEVFSIHHKIARL